MQCVAKLGETLFSLGKTPPAHGLMPYLCTPRAKGCGFIVHHDAYHPILTVLLAARLRPIGSPGYFAGYFAIMAKQ